MKSLKSEVSSLKDQVSSISELSGAFSRESDVLRDRLDRADQGFEEKLELAKAELLRDSSLPSTCVASDLEERSTLLAKLEAMRQELDEKTNELEEAVGLARKFHELSFDNCLDQFRLLHPSMDLASLDPYKCVRDGHLVPMNQKTYPLVAVLDELGDTPSGESSGSSHSDQSSPSPEVQSVNDNKEEKGVPTSRPGVVGDDPAP